MTLNAGCRAVRSEREADGVDGINGGLEKVVSMFLFYDSILYSKNMQGLRLRMSENLVGVGVSFILN